MDSFKYLIDLLLFQRDHVTETYILMLSSSIKIHLYNECDGGLHRGHHNHLRASERALQQRISYMLPQQIPNLLS